MIYWIKEVIHKKYKEDDNTNEQIEEINNNEPLKNLEEDADKKRKNIVFFDKEKKEEIEVNSIKNERIKEREIENKEEKGLEKREQVIKPKKNIIRIWKNFI